MSAGGKAVSAGSDFQNRVGAWFLAFMWLEQDVAPFFAIPGPAIPIELAFETNDSVDDLRVVFADARTAYVQAKRRIDFSESVDSEFGGVVTQFVRQHEHDRGRPDPLILATSSGASRKLTVDLRNYLQRFRDHSGPVALDPQNQSEATAAARFRAVVENVHLRVTGTPLDDGFFVSLCRRTHVEQMDLLDGHSLDKAFLLLLAPRSAIGPELLRSVLITAASSYATRRAVVNAPGIAAQLDQYVGCPEASCESFTDTIQELLSAESINWRSGVECLLLEDFPEDDVLLIGEIERFSENGTPHVTFQNGTVRDPAWKRPARVLFRASTLAGVERFVTENRDLLPKKELVVYGSNFDSDPNDSPFARAHGAKCISHFRHNTPIDSCLHCGKVVNEPTALIAEIDEGGRLFAAGLIHGRCRQPTDRIVARCQFSGVATGGYLVKFDINKWLAHAPFGQRGLQGSLRISQLFQTVPTIIWNPENNSKTAGSYCVQVSLSDGTTRFMDVRGRIDRMTRSEAEHKCDALTTIIRKGKEDNDPMCYSSRIFAFGPRSHVNRMKEPDENTLEWEIVQIAPYTATAEQTDWRGGWYAPVCYLRRSGGDEPLLLGKCLPLLSNPLDVERFVSNWRRMDFDVPDCYLDMFATDSEFDLFMYRCDSEQTIVLVDPLFDFDQRPTAGIVVMSREAAMRSVAEDSN